MNHRHQLVPPSVVSAAVGRSAAASATSVAPAGLSQTAAADVPQPKSKKKRKPRQRKQKPQQNFIGKSLTQQQPPPAEVAVSALPQRQGQSSHQPRAPHDTSSQTDVTATAAMATPLAVPAVVDQHRPNVPNCCIVCDHAWRGKASKADRDREELRLVQSTLRWQRERIAREDFVTDAALQQWSMASDAECRQCHARGWLCFPHSWRWRAAKAELKANREFLGSLTETLKSALIGTDIAILWDIIVHRVQALRHRISNFPPHKTVKAIAAQSLEEQQQYVEEFTAAFGPLQWHPVVAQWAALREGAGPWFPASLLERSVVPQMPLVEVLDAMMQKHKRNRGMDPLALLDAVAVDRGFESAADAGISLVRDYAVRHRLRDTEGTNRWMVQTLDAKAKKLGHVEGCEQFIARHDWLQAAENVLAHLTGLADPGNVPTVKQVPKSHKAPIALALQLGAIDSALSQLSPEFSSVPARVRNHVITPLVYSLLVGHQRHRDTPTLAAILYHAARMTEVSRELAAQAIQRAIAVCDGDDGSPGMLTVLEVAEQLYNEAVRSRCERQLTVNAAADEQGVYQAAGTEAALADRDNGSETTADAPKYIGPHVLQRTFLETVVADEGLAHQVQTQLGGAISNLVRSVSQDSVGSVSAEDETQQLKQDAMTAGLVLQDLLRDKGFLASRSRLNAAHPYGAALNAMGQWDRAVSERIGRSRHRPLELLASAMSDAAVLRDVQTLFERLGLGDVAGPGTLNDDALQARAAATALAAVFGGFIRQISAASGRSDVSAETVQAQLRKSSPSDGLTTSLPTWTQLAKNMTGHACPVWAEQVTTTAQEQAAQGLSAQHDNFNSALEQELQRIHATSDKVQNQLSDTRSLALAAAGLLVDARDTAESDVVEQARSSLQTRVHRCKSWQSGTPVLSRLEQQAEDERHRQLVDMISGVPVLEGLEDALLWDVTLERQLGSLSAVVEGLDLSEVSDWTLVQTERDGWVRVPVVSDLDGLRQALEAGDARDAAGQIMGLVVTGSLWDQQDLVKATVEGWWKLQSHDRKAAARLMVTACDMLDPPLQPLVGYAILLQGCVQSHDSVAQTMLDTTWKLSQRRMLQRIGVACGVPRWAKDASEYIQGPKGWRRQEQRLVSGQPRAGSGSSQPSTPVLATDGAAPSAAPVTAAEPTQAQKPVQAQKPAADSAPTPMARTGSTAASQSESYELCKAIRESNGSYESSTLATMASDPVRDESIKKMRGTIAKAVSRLAAELYSQQVHFLLELIQNADDNTYPPEHVPTLRITLMPDELTFWNNEQGFTEANVRALSDIGASTKKKSAAGYIGNKGIGFKSVFRVTDNPQIHSRCFHFEYDIATDSLGYVLPNAIEPLPGWDPAVAQTDIRLPLRRSSGLDGSTMPDEGLLEDLTQSLSDIQPHILLFLHRLRRLEIVNTNQPQHTSQVTGGTGGDGPQLLSMEKYEHQVGEHTAVDVMVSSGPLNTASNAAANGKVVTECSRWLIVRREAKPGRELAVKRFNDDSIADDVSTEVCAAFPEIELGGSWDRPAYDVFGYLPVANYGLRFILQADWELPASREAVTASSSWNQWLRGEASKLMAEDASSFFVSLFEEALEEPRRDTPTVSDNGTDDDSVSDVGDATTNGDVALSAESIAKAVHYMNIFYSSIPEPQLTQGFFVPCIKDISARLATQAIVTVDSGDDFKACKLVQPSMAVRGDSPLLHHLKMEKPAFLRRLWDWDRSARAAIPEARRPAEWYLLHSEAHISPGVASVLGVRSLDQELLAEIIGRLTRQWAEASTVDADPAVHEDRVFWLMEAVSLLSGSRRAIESLRETLRVPTLTGWTAVSAGKVYMSDTKRGGAALAQYGQLGHVQLLHKHWQENHWQYTGFQSILRSLGVQLTNSSEFVFDVLIPAMSLRGEVGADGSEWVYRQRLAAEDYVSTFRWAFDLARSKSHPITMKELAQRMKAQHCGVMLESGRMAIALDCEVPESGVVAFTPMELVSVPITARQRNQRRQLWEEHIPEAVGVCAEVPASGYTDGLDAKLLQMFFSALGAYEALPMRSKRRRLHLYRSPSAGSEAAVSNGSGGRAAADILAYSEHRLAQHAELGAALESFGGTLVEATANLPPDAVACGHLDVVDAECPVATESIQYLTNEWSPGKGSALAGLRFWRGLLEREWGQLSHMTAHDGDGVHCTTQLRIECPAGSTDEGVAAGLQAALSEWVAADCTRLRTTWVRVLCDMPWVIVGDGTGLWGDRLFRPSSVLDGSQPPPHYDTSVWATACVMLPTVSGSRGGAVAPGRRHASESEQRQGDGVWALLGAQTSPSVDMVLGTLDKLRKATGNHVTLGVCGALYLLLASMPEAVPASAFEEPRLYVPGAAAFQAMRDRSKRAVVSVLEYGKQEGEAGSWVRASEARVMDAAEQFDSNHWGSETKAFVDRVLETGVMIPHTMHRYYRHVFGRWSRDQTPETVFGGFGVRVYVELDVHVKVMSGFAELQMKQQRLGGELDWKLLNFHLSLFISIMDPSLWRKLDGQEQPSLVREESVTSVVSAMSDGGAARGMSTPSVTREKLIARLCEFVCLPTAWLHDPTFEPSEGPSGWISLREAVFQTAVRGPFQVPESSSEVPAAVLSRMVSLLVPVKKLFRSGGGFKRVADLLEHLGVRELPRQLSDVLHVTTDRVTSSDGSLSELPVVQLLKYAMRVSVVRYASHWHLALSEGTPGFLEGACLSVCTRIELMARYQQGDDILHEVGISQPSIAVMMNGEDGDSQPVVCVVPEAGGMSSGVEHQLSALQEPAVSLLMIDVVQGYLRCLGVVGPEDGDEVEPEVRQVMSCLYRAYGAAMRLLNAGRTDGVGMQQAVRDAVLDGCSNVETVMDRLEALPDDLAMGSFDERIGRMQLDAVVSPAQVVVDDSDGQGSGQDGRTGAGTGAGTGARVRLDDDVVIFDTPTSSKKVHTGWGSGVSRSGGGGDGGARSDVSFSGPLPARQIDFNNGHADHGEFSPAESVSQYFTDPITEGLQDVLLEHGRRGERAVKAYLAERARPGMLEGVVWVNEHAERGTPYDLTLQVSPQLLEQLVTGLGLDQALEAASESGENAAAEALVTVYVEVKAIGSQSGVVYISPSELRHGRDHAGRYWLVVVGGVSHGSPWLRLEPRIWERIASAELPLQFEMPAPDAL